jgi:hypothetical protein
MVELKINERSSPCAAELKVSDVVAIEARRRKRALAQAMNTLRHHQEAKTFGVVSFHLQAGRLTRIETRITEKVDS